MTDQLRVYGHLVDDLSSAARHGGSALADAPVLLKRVLVEGAWREFVTQRGDHVVHERFSAFVTTPPLKGLGVDMALVERVVGTEDPELLLLLRDAEKVGAGFRSDLQPGADSSPGDSHGNGQSDYLAQRLSAQHPGEYAAVKSGELSINAAAVLAGIRPRRISVRLDRPESLAQSLRRHLTAEQLAAVRALLEDP